MYKYSIFKRSIATVVAFFYLVLLVPAQEFYFEREQGLKELNYYLNLAQQERNQARWDKLADEGVIAAMATWESATLQEKEKDFQTWQVKKQQVHAFYEQEKNLRYAKWLINGFSQGRKSSKQHELYLIMDNLGQKWNYIDQDGNSQKEITENEIKEVLNQWNNAVSESEDIKNWWKNFYMDKEDLLILLDSVDIDSSEKESLVSWGMTLVQEYLQMEFQRIMEAEGNNILSEMLYDRNSLKYLSSKEAAQVIATQLAQEAKEESDLITQELFSMIDNEISNIQDNEIILHQENWSEEFNHKLKEGLSKWEDAEKEFLLARNQWEIQGEETFLEGEKNWQTAYNQLRLERQQWENNTLKAISEGLEKWDSATEELKLQIYDAEMQFSKLIMDERNYKEKTLNSQITLYNQSRQMMALCVQGIQGWFQLWSEKYNNVYHYWKTEDNSFFSQDSYIKGFTKDKGVSFNDKYVVDLDYFISEVGTNELLNQISKWKSGYLKMLAQNIENKDLSIFNENLDQLNKELEKIETEKNRIKAAIYNSSSSNMNVTDNPLLYSDNENEVFDPQKELKLLEEKKSLILERIQQVNNEISSLKNIISKLNNTSSNVSTTQIQNILGNKYSSYFDAELWESDKSLFDANEGWISLAKEYKLESEKSIRKQYEVFGLVVSDPYMDNLYLEKIKNQAKIKYWETEVKIAQALNDYAQDVSSGIEKSEDSLNNLKTAELEYELKVQEYEKILNTMDHIHLDIQEVSEELNSKSKILTEKQQEVEKAREMYQQSLLALEGLNTEYLKSQCLIILEDISFLGQEENIENATLQFQEYLETYATYNNFLLKDTINQICLDIINGVTSNLSNDELFNLSEEGKNLLIKADSSEKEETFWVEVNNYLEKVKNHFPTQWENLEKNNFSTTENEILKKNIFQEELSKLLIEIENELHRRNQIISYLKGNDIDKIWEDLNSQKVIEIQETYKDFRQENLKEKDLAAWNNLQAFFEQIDKIKNQNLEVIIERFNEVLLGTENLHNSSLMVRDEIFNNILTWRGIKDYYEGNVQKITEEQIKSIETELEEGLKKYNICLTWQQNISNLQTWIFMLQNQNYDIFSLEEMNLLEQYTATIILQNMDCSDIFTVEEFISKLNEEKQSWQNNFLALETDLQEKIGQYVIEINNGQEKTEIQYEEVLAIINSSKKLFEANNLAKNWELIYYQGIFSEQNDSLEKSLSILKEQGIEIDSSCMDYKLNAVNAKIIQQKKALENLYATDSLYEIGINSQATSLELEERINSLIFKYYESVDIIQLVKDLEAFANGINALSGSFEKLEEACINANSALVKANEDSLLAKEEYEAALETYLAIIDEYDNISKQTDTAFEETEKARTELRIAQKKYEWGTSVYLKAKGGSIESPKEKLDQALYSLEIAKLTEEALESVILQKNIENSEYNEAQLEYVEAKRQQYLTVVLAEESAKAIYDQKNTIRKLEAEESAIRSSIIKSVDSFTPEDYKWTELICVEKDQNGNYVINLAYDINTNSSMAFKQAMEQNNEILIEYVTNKSYILQRLDSNEEYTLCEKEGFDWWQKVCSTNDNYANDLMLASLYLKSLLDESFLEGSKNPRDKNAFYADTIPTHSIFHGLDIGEMYLECRLDELKKAWEKVIKNEQGKEDVAKLLVYGNTVLLEDIEARTYYELEKRALKTLEKQLKDKENQAYKNATLFYSLAAGYSAFGIFNGLGFVMASAMLINATNETDKGNSIKAVRYATENLRKGKTTMLKTLENSNLEKISLWENYSDELKINNEKLFIMEGSNTDNSLMDYEKFSKAVNLIVENSNSISQEDIKIICSEEIFNKAHEGKESYGTEISTENIKNLFDKKLNDSNNNLENVVAKLNQKAEVAKTQFYGLLEEINSLDEETKKLLRQLWQSSGDDRLTERERKIAEKEYEKEIENSKKIAEEKLKSLKEIAQIAFGSWNENQHKVFIAEQEVKLLGQNTNINKETEEYTNIQQRKVFQGVMELLDLSYTEELKIQQENWILELERQENEKIEWFDQAMNIVETGRKEWVLAEEKINAGYNKWRKDFITKYEKGKENFQDTYSEYLEEKNKWIQKEYLYATGYGSVEDIERSGSEVEGTLAQVLSKLKNSETNVWKEEATKYIEENASIGKDYSIILSNLQGSISTGLIKTHTRGLTEKAREIQEEVNADVEATTAKMEKLAGKIAAEYAEQIIQQTRESYEERLNIENAAMENWQKKLVLESGYEVGGEIKRVVLVDATISGGVYETQKIKKYEPFEAKIPEINKTLNILVKSGYDATKQIESAQKNLKNWADRIFGKVEENGGIKEWKIPREVAKKGDITEYEKKDKSKEAEEKIEELMEKGKIISLRDGELGRHIGYSPIFKEKFDINEPKKEIIKESGLGEIENIMLDYQWNSIRAGAGLTELSKSAYDKKLWVQNNSFFEPPTLRGIVDIAANIAGNILGGPAMGAVLGYADDLLFASLDLVGGHKSIEQVGLELGKKAAMQVIGAKVGGMSNDIAEITKGLTGLTPKLVNTFTTAGSNYITGVANSYINSINYTEADGWSMDWDSANSSWVSKNVVASAIGAGTNTFVTMGLSEYNLGVNNTNVKGFNILQIDSIESLNNLAGGLAENGVLFAFGENATFNLSNIHGVGLLELTMSKEGISSRLGMGGTDISYENIRNAINGATNLHKNHQINKTGYDKTTLDALRSQWGFGDEVAKTQLDSII
ncbi:MAG: hypothetical protein J6B32_03835, partial [Spirochaetaceae bacterium]|nr:hypothetical protein [Spirochaetaceae bacterium]